MYMYMYLYFQCIQVQCMYIYMCTFIFACPLNAGCEILSTGTLAENLVLFPGLTSALS